jgi:HSP20 family protein
MNTAAETRAEPQAARPGADIYETAETVEIRLDMPGVPRDGIQVTLEGDDLLVEGTMPEPVGEPAGRSRLPRRYQRLFTLSDVVSREGIRARIRDGVLELTLPKSERVRPRSIPIEGADEL